MRMTARKFIKEKGDLFAMYLFPNEKLRVINYINTTNRLCDFAKPIIIDDFISNRKTVAETLAFANK